MIASFNITEAEYASLFFILNTSIKIIKKIIKPSPYKGTKAVRGTTQFDNTQAPPKKDCAYDPLYAHNAGLRQDFSSAARRAGSRKIISENLSAGEFSSLLESYSLLILFIALFEYVYYTLLLL
jgi:hypothetical protein